MKLFMCIVLLLISVVVFTHELTEVDFQQDEYQVIEAAQGFRKEGDFYKWDFRLNESGKNTDCIENDKRCNYTRAFPHTILVSASAEIFGGINEFSARIPSVIFGAIFVLVYFLFSYWLAINIIKTNRKVSLSFAFLSSLFIVFNPIHKDIFGTVRMYALLYPISILLVWLLIKIFIRNKIVNNQVGLEKELKTMGSLFEKTKAHLTFIIKFLKSKSRELFLLVIIFSIGFLLHINIFILGLSVVTCSALQIALNNSKSYIYKLISVLGVMSVLTLIIFKVLDFEFTKEFTRHFTIRSDPNFQYFYYFIEYPFQQPVLSFIALGIPLLLMVLVNLLPGSIFHKYKKLDEFRSNEIYFLSSIILTASVFFTFFADRYATYFYLSFVTPIGYVLVSVFYLKFFSTFKDVKLKVILVGFVTVILTACFTITMNYERRHQAAITSEYEAGYSKVLEGVKSDDFILMQFPRKYYLKGENELNLINMGREESFKLKDLEILLNEYESGYIIWADEKRESHIDDDLARYLNESNSFEEISKANDGLTIYTLR